MKIHDYIKNGDIESLAADKRVARDIEAFSDEGLTPLMLAVMQPNVDERIIEWLIDNGANLNAETIPKPVFEMDESTVSFMKEEGMDVTYIEQARAMPYTAESVLGIAAKHGSLRTIELLIKNGANVSWADPGGYTPLLSSFHRPVETAPDEQLRIVELFVDAGADVNACSSWGESPLSVCSRTLQIDIIKVLLSCDANDEQLAWPDLCWAVVNDSPADVARAIESGADIEHRDLWERTPFLLAVACGHLRIAQQLIAAGCDQSATGRCGQTAIGFSIDHNRVEILEWLLQSGPDLNAPCDDFGTTPLEKAIQHDDCQCLRVLLAADADPSQKCSSGENLMTHVGSMEAYRLLSDAGLDGAAISSENRADIFSRDSSLPLNATSAEYRRQSKPIFGKANPDQVEHAFKNEMVRTRASGWAASRQYGKASIFGRHPIWCFSRFGQSLTELPSGEFVEVGGEHEDHYDPDFCIYNDVVVHDGRGEFRIFTYPRSVFPPTDFHTATFVDGFIYVVGCLGYPDDRRPGNTPIYRLDCKTWKIEQVRSSGTGPGWIYRHSAKLDGTTIKLSGGTIWTGTEFTDNTREFTFDCAKLTWN
ncbi:MAG: ankyrin repeat domain-containing protein [Fuerstiella sp.]